MTDADGERIQEQFAKRARRLVVPRADTAPPPAVVSPPPFVENAAPAVAVAPAGDAEPMARLNWYMTRAARDELVAMRDEIFFAAGGAAEQRYDAAAALIEVMRADFDSLKLRALDRLVQRRHAAGD